MNDSPFSPAPRAALPATETALGVANPSRKETARLLGVAIVWSATFHLLSSYGALALPVSIARILTLESFLAIVHVLTVAVGLVTANVLLSRPRQTLALVAPTAPALAMLLGLAPAVFATTTTVAFLVARPTLLAELIAGGQQLVRQSTGRFGRELVQSPASLALLWGAVLSPISEELFFRGALWSLVQRIVSGTLATDRSLAATAGEQTSTQQDRNGGEESLGVPLYDGMFTRVTRHGVRWARSGGGATLVVGLLFGVLHDDMPGGLGIVRFIAALGLGLACGVARQLGGSVFLPILLHGVFNALSVAAVRRWVVTDFFPMRWGAPTLVTALALLGVAGVVALRIASTPRTRRSE
jgi:membrane protease YdiL (CAAX protease family)